MERLASIVCSICGKPRLDETPWFLITEDSWHDKLQILRWDEDLAHKLGWHSVCNPAHLQQMTVHWMTTGSLNHPFAQSLSSDTLNDGYYHSAKMQSPLGNAQFLGELAVHRESMQRVLYESPASLQAILDALLCAVQGNSQQSSRT